MCVCVCVCLCVCVCVRVSYCNNKLFTMSLQAIKVLLHIASDNPEARDCVLKHGMIPALMKCVHSLALHNVCNCIVFLSALNRLSYFKMTIVFVIIHSVYNTPPIFHVLRHKL